MKKGLRMIIKPNLWAKLKYAKGPPSIEKLEGMSLDYQCQLVQDIEEATRLWEVTIQLMGRTVLTSLPEEVAGNLTLNLTAEW